jgi:hypothetical protein
MDQTYVVQAVGQPRPWNGQYGPMVSYDLDVVDPQGSISTVELNQKPDTPAPQANAQLFGRIEQGTRGLRFKKAQQPQQGQLNGAQRRDDPDRQRSIVRQHSQHMALLYFQIKGSVGGLSELVTAIDWFERDAQGQQPSPAQSQAVQQAADVPPPTPAQADASLPF